MKKEYYTPSMTLVVLSQEDIVRTSPNGFDDVEDDPFKPNSSSQSNFG